MRQYPAITNALNSSVWAIMPAKLDVIVAFVAKRIANGQLTLPDVTGATWHSVAINGDGDDLRVFVDGVGQAAAAPVQAAAGSSRLYRTIGRTAIIEIVGSIIQRMDMMSAISGGASTITIGQAFEMAMSDPEVGAVLINVDSPGGSVFGLDELSAQIFAKRGRKPIIAIANSLMASAAYYIASAADEIVITPGGQAGSIGTLAIHLDTSQADERAGFKYTLISAGDNKTLGTSTEPLSDDARAYYQAMVDKYYQMFLAAVARGRNTTTDKVEKRYGQGKLFIGDDAVRAGLADRVATFDQTIQRIDRKLRYER